MTIAGYLEVPDIPGESPDIPGESKAKPHRDQIEVHGIAWNVARAPSGATGAGRTQAAADVGPLVLHKFYDAASPYLALAAMQRRAFDEVRVVVEAATEAHFDYLEITLQNCSVTAYEILAPDADKAEPAQNARKRRAAAGPIRERISFDFEQIRMTYTERRPNGSAGAEHEIEYDVEANA